MKRISSILAIVIYILPYTACAQSFSLYDKPRIGMELGNRLLKWQENMGQDHFCIATIRIPFWRQLEFPFS